jgi:uncharacterized protein YbaR (Trm112 family)
MITSTMARDALREALTEVLACPSCGGSYRQKLWMREKGDVPFWGS